MKLYKRHSKLMEYDIELNAMQFMTEVWTEKMIKVNNAWPSDRDARIHNNLDKDIFGKNLIQHPFLFKVYNK